MKNDYIKIPKSFVFSKNLKQYDFKAMRLYFDSILKGMGDTTESKEYLLKKKIREDKNKLCKFVEVVSTIHFYRYKQEEIVDIIQAIKKEIYGKNTIK